MKNSIYFYQLFIVFLFLNYTTNSIGQSPQYYNYNTTNISNFFPFGVTAGKKVQFLILPGELNHPTPITNGYLTKMYIMMSYHNGNVTLTDLTIKLGQTSITAFPSGSLYTGSLDTVYFRPTVTLTSTIGNWMVLTLDKPFCYDSTKSLVIDISQCGATINNYDTMCVAHSLVSNNQRIYANHSGSCVFTYSGLQMAVLNCGFDIMTAPSTPNYYNTNTGTGNIYPFGVTAGKKCQWLIRSGDFIQPNSAPSGYITSLYFYMSASTTTTFNQLLVKLGRTSLTNLPNGAIYSGQLDTVYYRFSVTLSSVTANWMRLNLDKAFYYDNTKSLVIDVSQCVASNSSMSLRQSTGTGFVRNFNNNATGACLFTYSGEDAQIINAGVNLYTFLGIRPVGDYSLPRIYSLEQNYPNPFNPSTKIKFSIPPFSTAGAGRGEIVKLVIYDILGRDVATLVNEKLQPGTYEVEFYGSNYPSGVYFYKLTTESFSETKRLVILK